MLNKFFIIFTNNKFRFSSLTVAYQSSMQIYNHEGSDGISKLKFCKPSGFEHVYCVSLICRKHIAQPYHHPMKV